jgi:hypothetical protein
VLQKMNRPYRSIRTDSETHARAHRLAATSDQGVSAYLRKALYIFETGVIFPRLRDDERPRYMDGSLTTAESGAITNRLQWLVHRIQAVTPQQLVSGSRYVVALDLDSHARAHRAAALLNCKLIAFVRWLTIERETRWVGLMTAAEKIKIL